MIRKMGTVKRRRIAMTVTTAMIVKRILILWNT